MFFKYKIYSDKQLIIDTAWILKHLTLLTQKKGKKLIFEKFYIVDTAKSSCFYCGKPRQIKKNSKKIKNVIRFYDFGIMNVLKYFQMYQILIDPEQKICMNCLDNITNSSKLNQTKLKIYQKNKHQQYALKILQFRKWQQKLFIKQKKHPKFIDEIIHDLSIKITRITTSKYKNIFGLTRDHLLVLFKEIINVLDEYFTKTGLNYLKYVLNDKTRVFTYDLDVTKDITRIKKAILCVLSKWKVNASCDFLSITLNIGPNQFIEFLQEASPILYIFAQKHLINTRSKLKECQVELYNELMGISKDINVIIADGCRYRIVKPDNYAVGYLSYDLKHRMNSFNSIGIVAADGRFVGFYPKQGIGSDGTHSDGGVFDYILLNNYDNIGELIDSNNAPYDNTGTKILFDRAIPHHSISMKYGIYNFSYPCNSKGKQTQYQNNATRYECTFYRWQIERAFSILSNRWSIFHAATSNIHGNYINLMGIWLDGAASITNYLNLSKNIITPWRKIQAKWLLTRKIELNVTPQDKTLLQIIGDRFINKKSIKNIWIKATSVFDLVSRSIYWTKNKILEQFDLNADEALLYGGGTFPIDNAKKYLTHSRYYIELYFSNEEVYKNILMVRGIKNKMSRDYITNPNKKFYIVLLSKRREIIDNIFNINEFSYKLRSIDHYCTCNVGARTLHADSHVMTSLLYITKYFLFNKDIPVISKKSSNYEGLLDIRPWYKQLKSLSMEAKKILAVEHCEQFGNGK